MAKSRLGSNLSVSSNGKKPPAHSHRHSLVWQWLQSLKPGTDEAGVVIRILRDKTNMPGRFPHRTALQDYMIRCKIDTATTSRTVIYLYNLYMAYSNAVLHPDGGEGASVLLDPKDVGRSGINRKQIARVVFQNLGIQIIGDPDDHFNQGGKWVDTAYDVADAVIGLVSSTLHAKRETVHYMGKPPKLGNLGTSKDPWKDYND